MAKSYQSDRENWLVRFLGVQSEADAKLNQALKDALDSISAALRGLEGKPGVGAATRRTQLLGNQGVITRVLNILYNKAGVIIRSGQSDAAGAATLAELKESRKILWVIEKDADKRAVLERSLEQSSRRNVQTMMTRILNPEQPLSKRIYNSKALVRGQVSRAVNTHLAKGSSAEELSRDVRQFFDPKVAGGVNAAARRLARTEINNAFHAQSIADMQDRPWVNNIRWNLSKSHPAKQAYDKCDEYARIGLFPPENVPPKPHPNCLCFVVPEMPDIETAMNEYLAGNYNSWIADNMDDDLRRSA